MFMAVYRVVFYRSLIVKTPKNMSFIALHYAIFFNTVLKLPEY